MSTSKIIEDIALNSDANIFQTKIGEPNVTAKIKELNAVVGGEGNGGVIYPTIGWGRDSLVGIVLALKFLAETKQSVSKIVSSYPTYKILREKFRVDNKKDVVSFLNKVETYLTIRDNHK